MTVLAVKAGTAGVVCYGLQSVNVKHRLVVSLSAIVLVLQAGQIAAAEGAAGLVLHARTADQQYGPPSHWDAIAQLVAAVLDHVPVIGNGDVSEAADAVQIMRQTGCQGG
jgi:tRNA-dihydrouridine synthase